MYAKHTDPWIQEAYGPVVKQIALLTQHPHYSGKVERIREKSTSRQYTSRRQP